MSLKTEEELVAGKGAGAEEVPDGAQSSQEGEPVTLVESGEPAGEVAPDPAVAMAAELAKWKDLALRSQAELDNFRKRMAREKADAIRYGNAAMLESLLPVLDNFGFGLDAAKQAGQSVVVDGMSMVFKQFNDLLGDFGVQEVTAEGAAFDPNLHEAVKEEASPDVPDGQVIAVVRRGYRLADRLLRPANVIVSRGPAEAPDSGTARADGVAGSGLSSTD